MCKGVCPYNVDDVCILQGLVPHDALCYIGQTEVEKYMEMLFREDIDHERYEGISDSAFAHNHSDALRRGKVIPIV